MIVGVAMGTYSSIYVASAAALLMGATAEDLALTIHPHPTLSETLMEAAEMHLGHCTHVYRKKKQGDSP